MQVRRAAYARCVSLARRIEEEARSGGIRAGVEEALTPTAIDGITLNEGGEGKDGERVNEQMNERRYKE